MPVLYTPEQQALFDHDAGHWTPDATPGIWRHAGGQRIEIHTLTGHDPGTGGVPQIVVECPDSIRTLAILELPLDAAPQPGITGLLDRLRVIFSPEHRRLMDVFWDEATAHCVHSGMFGHHHVLFPDPTDPESPLMVLDLSQEAYVLELPDSLRALAEGLRWIPVPIPVPRSGMSSYLRSEFRLSIPLVPPACMHVRMKILEDFLDIPSS